MLRANLETVVLQLKKLKLGSPKELLAMALDPPAISGIERAVANLKEVKFSLTFIYLLLL
jgi:ATP-dependent RNA helicase TDRD9